MKQKYVLLPIVFGWFLYIGLLVQLGQPFSNHWPLMAVMVLGSFVAGATAAGGGAIAFPALTLLLTVAPADARDFALCIQSVGMTAASMLIIYRAIPVDWATLRLLALPGLMGLLAGNQWIVPMLDARRAKLSFGTIWFAFAIALYFVNATANYHRREKIDLSRGKKKAFIIVTAFCGGLLTACFGSGADLAIFSVIVLYFGLCEKVATPTSVIAMAFLSILGTATRFLTSTVTAQTMDRWIACIPVVIIGAPLGAYVCSILSRQKVVNLLIFILCLQFAGVLFVLTPTFSESIMLTFVLASGLIFFRSLSRAPQESEDIGEELMTVADHQGAELRPNNEAQYQVETSDQEAPLLSQRRS